MLFSRVNMKRQIAISLLLVFTISSLYADTDIQRAQKIRTFQQQYWQLESGSSTPPACIFRALTIADQPERDTFNKEWLRPGEQCNLKLSACGNEIRSAQFAVVHTGKINGILNIDLTVTDFKSETGTVIPAENVSVQAVDFVPTDKPRSTRTGYNGWKADVLLPKGPIKVYPDATTPVWIKIKVPAGTPKGKYLGRINSNASSQPVVNIELNVWEFDLPDETHFPTSFWISRGQLNKYYGRELTWEEYTPWLNAVLEARLSPIDFKEGPCENWFKAYKEPDGRISIDISKWQRYAEYICQRGATAINVGPTHWFGKYIKRYPGIDRLSDKPIILNSQESRKAFSLSLVKAWEFLKRNGWSDRAYLQPYDEPRSDEAYEEVKEILSQIRQVAPKLNTLIPMASHGHEKFPVIAEMLDIYVPHNSVYTPAELAELHSKGKLGWTYLCTKRSPSMVFKQPWDSRLMWWRYFDSGIDGYLYWSTNYWSKWAAKRPVLADRWPAKPWQLNLPQINQGDGVYLLPGPDMKPYPRLCLELTREGMQDYEYFWLLRKLASSDQNKTKYPELCRRGKDLLNKISEVVQNNSKVSISEYQRRPGKGSVMSEWFWKAPQGSEVIEEYRTDVAELIEKLNSH